jgi:hypothetical protein
MLIIITYPNHFSQTLDFASDFIWGLFEALLALVKRDTAPSRATIFHDALLSDAACPARSPPMLALYSGSSWDPSLLAALFIAWGPPPTGETTHPCHAACGWPWHGLGGKIQIAGFSRNTQRGWQTVNLDESVFSSMSHSVPVASSIFDLQQ